MPVFRCVFVDAGVASIDIETKKMKEEMKLKEAQAKSVAEHGELALITVDNPQTTAEEKLKLRPPMLQVVNFKFWCVNFRFALGIYSHLTFLHPKDSIRSLLVLISDTGL